MASLQHFPTFEEWFFGKEIAERIESRRAADVEPEPRPTATEGFTPSASEDAFWSGYTLGYEGEPADPPAGSSRRVATSFKAGWTAGALAADKESFEGWLDKLDRRERFEEAMASEFEPTESERWNGGMS